MEPTATYAGVLVDENDRPMAGRTLKFYIKESDGKAVAARKTDEAGRFRFNGVPANVPRHCASPNEGGWPEYFFYLTTTAVPATDERAGGKSRPAQAAGFARR